MNARGRGAGQEGGRGRGQRHRGGGRGAPRGNVRNGPGAEWPMRKRAAPNVAEENKSDDEGGGRSSSGKRNGGKIFPLSLKELEEMLLRQPSEVVLTLQNQRPRLKLRLQFAKLPPAFTLGILQALAVVAECKSCPANAMDVLNDALSSDFCAKHLPLYLKDAPFLAQEAQRLPHTLDVLVALMDSLLERFPNKASERLDYVFLTCKRIADNSSDDGPLIRAPARAKLEEMERRRQDIASKFDVATRERKAKEESEMAIQPDDDFRTVSVTLTHTDIHGNRDPFLRRNVVGGKYLGVDHYLDVHFRLLREDFIAPLRDGLLNYLALVRRKKQSEVYQRDIKIYYGVQACLPGCSPADGIVHRLNFDTTKLRRVRWEATKRLMYGSLVCLSSDAFQTFHLATIVRRDPKDLKEGYVVVRFIIADQKLCEVDPNEVFTMVESPAYFEAYSPILRGLQTLNEGTLSFQRYIVEAQTDVAAPRYLDGRSVYDFASLLGDAPGRSDKVRVLHDELWPTPDELRLDVAQHAALKTALTKEVAIIQGPPGTGKTFLGLKMVQVLLDNRSVWSNSDSPILVICYTNHALDQFLEGIVRYCGGDGVVRVGGQSKCEALKILNLSYLRRMMTDQRKVPNYVFHGRKKFYWELKQIENDIGRQLVLLKGSGDRLLRETELESFVGDKHYRQLLSITGSPGWTPRSSALLEWLGLGVTGDGSDVAGDESEVANDKQAGPAAGPQDGEEDEAESDAEDVLAEEEMQRRIVDDHFGADELGGFDVADDDADLFLPLPTVSRNGWQVQGNLKAIVKRELRKVEVMSDAEFAAITHVWKVPLRHRWSLYRYWMARLRKKHTDNIREYQKEYQAKYLLLKEVLGVMDVGILQGAKIIGMTTTGAAKNRDLLQAINPRIVIVEEAAEVLESHIITALNPHCQHLILIGDQQQLRPTTTVYNLSREYRLDVSLFERLIETGVHYDRLCLQHRMRPEIAALLVPHIYTDLRNHESVERNENVAGVQSNVFFVSHTSLEKTVTDTMSRENAFEAAFLVEFCKYLLMQGYDATRITILTTYLGQLYLIKQLARKTMVSHVRCTVVDNYQGEENDVILLSLVRSNADGNVGFLKVSNRVCVALSRAKMGLFCVGNFEFLAEHAPIWRPIVEHLGLCKRIGPTLVLQCQNHPRVLTEVSRAEDFAGVPEGGCRLPCEYRLPCGHQCPKACHAYDREHKGTHCLKPCPKTCPAGHQCPKQCYQPCDQCFFPVPKVSPFCGHTNPMPCHRDPTTVLCQQPCEKILPACGHQCAGKCGEACGPCTTRVKRPAPCGHVVEVACPRSGVKQALLEACNEPCKEILPCGHHCSGFCRSCRQGRMHVRCSQKCQRVLICGHTCNVPCAQSCPPCKRPCDNRCVHSRCQNDCCVPCSPCAEPCAWQCAHEQCTKLCREPCDRQRCNEPCTVVLSCKHQCIGLCGEICPKLCRVCNRDEVCELFFGDEDEPDARFVLLEDCNHVIEVGALDRWMDEGAEGGRVEMKACPKCKKVIRQNLRYGNQIKARFQAVIDVKSKIFGDRNVLQNSLAALERNADALDHHEGTEFAQARDVLAKELGQNRQRLSLLDVNNLSNKVQLMKQMQQLWLEKLTGRGLELVRDKLLELEDWFVKLSKRPSEKEFHDLSRELQRTRYLCAFLKGTSVVPAEPRARACYDQIMAHLTGWAPFTPELEETVTADVARLRRLDSGLGITNVEKMDILKALNMEQGHWFKCPNGHYYIITECGGAMQEGRCNECGLRIGGTQHALRADNRFAGEMDGSRTPSYPTLRH